MPYVLYSEYNIVAMKHSRKTGKKTTQTKKSLTSGGEGFVRIIGGLWRGQKLPVRQAEGLRPTSDRVRETLFNWLQFEVPGARCLDVFAGSGALGFEALSREARWVTFVEMSADTTQQLKQNQSKLKTDAMEVVQRDALQWLSKPTSHPFDIVFIDPPFHEGLTAKAFELLLTQGYVHDRSWLYLEQEKNLPWPELGQGWVTYREKTTAQVRFGLFRKMED